MWAIQDSQFVHVYCCTHKIWTPAYAHRQCCYICTGQSCKHAAGALCNSFTNKPAEAHMKLWDAFPCKDREQQTLACFCVRVGHTLQVDCHVFTYCILEVNCGDAIYPCICMSIMSIPWWSRLLASSLATIRTIPATSELQLASWS